jgi:hypothetical protein
VVGLHRNTVGRVLRIRELPEDIRAEYASGFRSVPRSVMEEIAATPDEAARRKLWDRAKGGASVKAILETRKAIRRDASEHERRHKTVGASLRTIVKGVRVVEENRDALDDAQRAVLRALRDQIDALL